MKYVLQINFVGEPNCKDCMLSIYIREKLRCAGKEFHPFCPENGCRDDCPLHMLHDGRKINK